MSAQQLSAAVQLIEKAAEEAEAYQMSKVGFQEGLKLMDIVEKFLKMRKRLLYGGFAINALLPKGDQFYDSAKELPDFDFLSPDPVTDVAELIQMFKMAGYEDVEPSLGIHEGTYKVFVNFQGVADITFCDPIIYASLFAESIEKQSLHICPVNYLRMNMYLELSRPAGDVTRWPKVYRRLLLFNRAYPFDSCDAKGGLKANAARSPTDGLSLNKRRTLYAKFVEVCKNREDVLLGIPDVDWIYRHPTQSPSKLRKTMQSRVAKQGFQVLSLSSDPKKSVQALKEAFESVIGTRESENLNTVAFDAVGELLPGRIELQLSGRPLVTVFETVACHAYIEVDLGRSSIVHVASIDTLLNFYFAFHYANISSIESVTPILCVAQSLVKLAHRTRTSEQRWPFPLFPVKCLGYQPSFAELKKAQRQRVKEQKDRLLKFRKTVRQASAKLSRSALASKAAASTRKSTKSKSKTRKVKSAVTKATKATKATKPRKTRKVKRV